MICECYRDEKNFLGKVGVCWGTAERDACSCGGDKSKCDFYPSVREEEKKPVTNYDRIVSKSPEELAKWLTSFVANTIKDCGLYTLSRRYEEDALNWLKKEVKE